MFRFILAKHSFCVILSNVGFVEQVSREINFFQRKKNTS